MSFEYFKQSKEDRDRAKKMPVAQIRQCIMRNALGDPDAENVYEEFDNLKECLPDAQVRTPDGRWVFITSEEAKLLDPKDVVYLRLGK